jgi:hypothetical protein
MANFGFVFHSLIHHCLRLMRIAWVVNTTFRMDRDGDVGALPGAGYDIYN